MRVYKRINDVYEVELQDCKKYFQFLQSDSCIDGGMTRQMIYHGDNNWKLDVE